nr:long-chain fatty acid transporter [Aurantimonas sp. VKM B-3413]
MVAASGSQAFAGGFQRGTADTDILFDPGTVSVRAGETFISPQRGFESINGRSGDFSDYTGDYVIPSLSFYLGGDPFGCAGTYTESFAGEADYGGVPGGALPSQVSSTESVSSADRLNLAGASSFARARRTAFSSDEFAVTCRASYSSDYGRFSLLGGVFVEDFTFDGASYGYRNATAGLAGTPFGASLSAAGSSIIVPTETSVASEGGFKPGWRLGMAYEKPEIALRIQALYRSEVVHDDITGTGSATVSDTAYVQLADGTTASIPTVFGPAGDTILGALPQVGTTYSGVSALSDAISPASLTINAQTGIATGTLLLASFRWTDWSTNSVAVSSMSIGGSTTSSAMPYYWRDGYTASIGLGRAFSDRFAGAVAIGYDRGVSTGADTTYTDLYSLSGGVSFRPDSWGEIRFGGLVGYWTSGSQSIAEGAFFDADVGNDIVLGVNASLKLSF